MTDGVGVFEQFFDDRRPHDRDLLAPRYLFPGKPPACLGDSRAHDPVIILYPLDTRTPVLILIHELAAAAAVAAYALYQR